VASNRKDDPVAPEEITLSTVDESRFGQLRELYALTWRATYEDRVGSAVVSDMVAQLSEPFVGGMAPAGVQVFGAYLPSGPLIGVSILREAKDVAYLWGMYVPPPHQKSGVGRRLMAAAIHSLTSARTVEVRVLKTSLGARAFYEALGFVGIREEDAEMFAGVVERLLVMACSRTGRPWIGDGPFPPRA